LFIACFFERNSILIDTVAFSEKEAADIISADQHPSIEPGMQDQKTYYVPARFYTLRQVLRFGLAGGLNTLVDVLTLNGLLWLFPPTSSLILLADNVLAYSLGAVNSFLLNKYWTFGQKQRTTRRELARFTLVTLCGIGWSTVIIWLASKVLHPLLVNPTVWANASKVVAIAGTALISYLGMRLWVFVSKRPKKQVLLYRALSAAENAGGAEHLLSMPMRGEASSERERYRPGEDENERASRHSLSVVLPAYNEEQVIASTISNVLDALSPWRIDAEVLVVNDGSTDRTGAIVAALAETCPQVRLITHPINQGYGAALASGFAAATKELTFFMDADGQFDIRDLLRFFQFIDEYDSVIGYRLNRQDSWMRKLNAWGWKCLIGWVLGIHVRDIDCAFKLLHSDFLHQHPLETRGAMINAELLYKLKLAGCTYREVGVHHLPRQGGHATGANPRVIAHAFRELFLSVQKWRREERVHAQHILVSEHHPF
jgi:putative flippase GtrA